jgi:hypothetical protein
MILKLIGKKIMRLKKMIFSVNGQVNLNKLLATIRKREVKLIKAMDKKRLICLIKCKDNLISC